MGDYCDLRATNSKIGPSTQCQVKKTEHGVCKAAPPHKSHPCPFVRSGTVAELTDVRNSETENT